MNPYEIKDPSMIKKLNISQLQELAKNIRLFLIGNISKTGGHLSSNLGIVELTIALHYVFDSPKDKLLFDVGHQAYVHKILTGRAQQFETLRKYQGLSGFQKRLESAHDVWEAGHSSTSLSAAFGMCIARDLEKEKYHVIP
ncbi:MAG: 1-deoxy-D-xylulose-5-phosphate synthase, partial [Erysipelotrichaceae bacterium]|nr:1-deoxy-D-xylulose-5-phosphate synthase [Erysipelotrichaceae bacterium]